MINKNIIFIMNVLLGILVIGFTVYQRFLVIRLPKDLHMVIVTVNYSLLLTILIGFLVCLFQLIKTIYYLKNSNQNIKGGFFIKLNEIIDNALFDLYNFMGNYIPNVYLKIALLAENFYALFHKHGEYLLLFILYFIRIIIIIAFLIDIFIFFKFDYFYKTLYLLCISLCIKCLLYIVRDFSTNLEEIESMLIVENKGLDLDTQLPLTEFALKDKYKNLNLDFYVKQYLLCSKLTGYFEYYDRYSKIFTPFINISLCLLYIIGWSYILFVNFFIIG